MIGAVTERYLFGMPCNFSWPTTSTTTTQRADIFFFGSIPRTASPQHERLRNPDTLMNVYTPIMADLPRAY